MDKVTYRAMSKDLLKALAEVEAKYDIKFTQKGARIDTATNIVTMKLELAPVAANGAVVDKHAEEFKRYARLLGFNETDLGRKFETYHGTYTLVGSNMRARKFPLLGRAANGKTYKFTRDAIKFV